MRVPLLLAASMLLTLPAAAAEPDITPAGFRSHVAFLADDLLEGRDAGTRGYDLAALYVAAQFDAAGLKPAVKGGWYQKVPLSPINTSGGWSAAESANVLGMVPGSDPELADEYVVMTAHLDHVGLAAGGDGDRIHNGALDNASGVAAMLEVAKAIAADGKRPRRTVLFAAVTAEEDGLIGSHHLARNPVVPRAKPVAVINIDMPVLLYDFTDVIAYGGNHSNLGEVAASMGRGMGIGIAADPFTSEDFFVRSDHFSFVQRGVPALFLMTGFGNGGEKKFKRFLDQDYHKPSDDMSLPIDWNAAAKFARLNYRIVRAVADADVAPAWYDDDEMGQTYAPRQRKVTRPR